MLSKGLVNAEGAGYCARLWDAEVGETLSQSLRFKGCCRRQMTECKQARVPPAAVWSHGDILEPGAGGEASRGFPEEGSSSELSLREDMQCRYPHYLTHGGPFQFLVSEGGTGPRAWRGSAPSPAPSRPQPQQIRGFHGAWLWGPGRPHPKTGLGRQCRLGQTLPAGLHPEGWAQVGGHSEIGIVSNILSRKGRVVLTHYFIIQLLEVF